MKYLLWDIDGTLLNFELAEDKAIHSCFCDFKLGNCTNEMLEKSGLNEVFDDVFISEEIGFEKPSVDYYKKVFQRIGSNNSEEYLMIGDSLTSDMQGGNNVGIMTCWFNPREKKNDTNIRVDYEISDLKEIIGILLN
ncbi:MAG: HAD-IA family hydrolase [Clostridia bacterium]|nr:HAD-IA family hydrolase [Clostridia bacterium]